MIELNAVLVRLKSDGDRTVVLLYMHTRLPPSFFFSYLLNDFTVLLGVKSHWDREITLNKMTKVQSRIPLYVGVDGSPYFPVRPLIF